MNSLSIIIQKINYTISVTKYLDLRFPITLRKVGIDNEVRVIILGAEI